MEMTETERFTSEAITGTIRAFKFPLADEELNALKEAFESGWIGTGIFRKLFEQRFAQFIDRNFCVATNSGTAALHLALRVLDVEGAEVITTSLTFIATNHAILYNHAIPVFCDVENDTGNIDPRKIPECITKKTKVILVVHLNGHACDMEPILEIAKKNNLFVVEDACQALGSFYKEKKLGSLGDLGCFSFGSKNITTVDGGVVVCNRADWRQRLMQLRHLGIKGNEGVEHDVEELGFQYGMNDIAAVIGLTQMKRWESMQARRMEIIKRFQEDLKDLSYVAIQTEEPETKNGWPVVPLRVTEGKMEALGTFLKQRGIHTDVIYPNHLYQLYKPYYRRLPIAEAIWKEILCLPLYPSLQDSEVGRMIDVIHEFRK